MCTNVTRKLSLSRFASWRVPPSCAPLRVSFRATPRVCAHPFELDSKSCSLPSNASCPECFFRVVLPSCAPLHVSLQGFSELQTGSSELQVILPESYVTRHDRFRVINFILRVICNSACLLPSYMHSVCSLFPS